MDLSAHVAQRMIAASHAKAEELGAAISTAIFDSEGRLFAFGRMSGAHWISVEVSQSKAFTGALLQCDGADLAGMSPDTLTALSALQPRGLMPLGSVTVVRGADGRVIAGIGCSGATDDQDHECARTARDAFAAG
ncbi:MAG: glycolate utilization protein [Aeromicrobium sp.]|nr:glycolate utilization protein [Aeromicrobium sp.]